jgi:hypothetical protein
MKSGLWTSIGACVAVACVSQVRPTVTPAKIRSVSPPIRARALLLIAPSFEKYLVEQQSGAFKIRTHYGKVAATALSALVTESFATAEIRRLPDEELQAWLAGGPDTSAADILLEPSFEAVSVQERTRCVDSDLGILLNSDPKDDTYEVFEMMFEVKLRLNVRMLRTGSSRSWVTSGGTGWRASSWRPLASSALEVALRSLSIMFASNREELERLGPSQ